MRTSAANTSTPEDDLVRAVADGSPVMMWTSTTEGRCLFVNRRWLAFTGRTLDDERGDGWLESVHGDDRHRFVADLRGTTGHRPPFTFEYRLRRADGEYRWMLGQAAPHLGADGLILGYVGSCAEIVDRVETEEQVRDSEAALRRLAARLQTTREEERATLARELHDELGQTLTAIKLELGRATAELRRQQIGIAAIDRLQSLVGLTEIGITTVKRITTNLRPATLDHLGIADAIRWEAMTFRARTGLRCHVRAAKDTTALTPDQQTALFRIFQEALTNIVRHARASAVYVTLAERTDMFELKIRDNGVGITEAQAKAPSAIGLLGMRERAALAGGDFAVEGRRGKGTAVTVRVPTAVPSRLDRRRRPTLKRREP